MPIHLQLLWHRHDFPVTYDAQTLAFRLAKSVQNRVCAELMRTGLDEYRARLAAIDLAKTVVRDVDPELAQGLEYACIRQ